MLTNQKLKLRLCLSVYQDMLPRVFYIPCIVPSHMWYILIVDNPDHRSPWSSISLIVDHFNRQSLPILDHHLRSSITIPDHNPPTYHEHCRYSITMIVDHNSWSWSLLIVGQLSRSLSSSISGRILNLDRSMCSRSWYLDNRSWYLDNRSWYRDIQSHYCAA